MVNTSQFSRPVIVDCRTRIDEGQRAAIRTQLAVVRSILDELEQIGALRRVPDVAHDQLVEELARLGCRVFDAALSLAKDVDDAKTATRSETELATATVA
jgi:hypothetical protein